MKVISNTNPILLSCSIPGSSAIGEYWNPVNRTLNLVPADLKFLLRTIREQENIGRVRNGGNAGLRISAEFIMNVTLSVVNLSNLLKKKDVQKVKAQR